MRIVYLIFNASYVAGGTRIIFEHVNGLAARGHQVELWQIEDAQPYFDLHVPIKAYSQQRLEEPDVIVMTDPAFIPDMLASGRKKGSTFLLLQHDFAWLADVTGTGLHADWFTANRSYFASGQCRVLVVSSWLQSVLKNTYDLDAHLVRNGVDRTIFYPAEPMQRQNNPVALLVYDPQNWKGFEDAINALLIVNTPNLTIAIIGRSYPLTPVHEGQYYGFSFPSVFFCRPNQQDLARIYSMATVFVSSSWKEGFGLPGVEALACGVPLVTTDSGGVLDYAIHDQTALVVPPKDVSALAESIARVLDDKKLRTKLARNGLKKAAEFDWAKSITKLETLFAETGA